MRSIVYVSLFVARWFADIGAFRSPLLLQLLKVVFPHRSSSTGCCVFNWGYPGFGNFDSTISIHVVGMKSYMDILFDRTRVQVGITINKLNLAPNRNIPLFVSVLRNCRGLSTSKPYVSVMFFYLFLHWSPCFTDIHFAAFTWDLVNRAVLFL